MAGWYSYHQATRYGIHRPSGRRRWDSNPRCSSHTRFPVAPTRPLWDSSRNISGIIKQISEAPLQERLTCKPDYMAERVGFEPTRLAPAAFRERYHKPLGHLSSCFADAVYHTALTEARDEQPLYLSRGAACNQQRLARAGCDGLFCISDRCS